ncbi:diacylglycerol kinase family protein [uncultured Megasphaera sp.]|uniref:diacylglycerol/lipid kinase family protein n=1 Tax=uncultured Megasphaera sp. TaxID=165188 RepID=UPI0025FDC23B|nr:diacylglycerol kinase family protein [uncultured Megasphaera sp.]
MKRCMLIVNPTAGRERAKYHKDNLRQQLETMFDEVELRETQKAGDATEWAKEAAQTGFEAVFSMGGDGTLNETINGLAQVKDSGIHFGFIPLGTINDLARALNIPLHPEEAIAMLQHCKTVKVDIAKANDRYFVNTIATGLMPEAVGHVSIEQKTRLGPLAYFLTGIKAMQAHKTSLFKITTAEGSAIHRSPLIVAMLTNSVGSFRNLAPQARVDDGKIWLGIFKDFNYLDLIKVIPEFLAGQPLTSELMTLKTMDRVRIELLDDSHLSTNMDGDEGPGFPLDIQVLPSFLSVYVPA